MGIGDSKQQAGNRIADDPVIKNISSGINTLIDNQQKFDEYLRHPEHGLFTRVKDAERDIDDINLERKKIKAWVTKLVWVMITALLLGGTIFGYKLSLTPTGNQQVEENK
jgi:hypothetical protein